MQILRNTALEIAILYTSLKRKLFRNSLSEIILIPPASQGSLGDQALLQGVQSYFDSKKKPAIRQALPRTFKEITLLDPCLKSICITNQSLRSDLRLIFALSNARMMCVTGADVMDGRYNVDQTIFSLYCLDLAAKAGVPSRLLGFSFSDEPKAEVIQKFKEISPAIRCFARDPVSKERFERATGRKIELSADLAFLVSPIAKGAEALTALDWMQEQRNKDDCLIIGLNANALTYKKAPERIVDAYADLIVKLSHHSRKIRFVFIPHDFRIENNDEKFHQLIASKLSENYLDRIHQTRSPLNAWDAKAIAQSCDLVLSGRMHLAIAALGSATPAVGIGYMGKFEGMLGYFGLFESLVTPEDAYLDLRLPQVLLHHLDKLNELRDLISRKLPSVRKMSLKNFDGIEP